MSILDQFKLDGKTALVSGACRGLGQGMALALAEAGADIIGVSKTLEKHGSEVEREIVTLGRRFQAFSCDFSDRLAVYEFLKKVHTECAAVDILVNNAGTILRAPAAEHPDDYWDEIDHRAAGRQHGLGQGRRAARTVQRAEVRQLRTLLSDDDAPARP